MSRPPTIAQLAKIALSDPWDPSKELMYYLRQAEKLRREAEAYLEPPSMRSSSHHEVEHKQDYELAFIKLCKAATLVMERIPEHRDFEKLLNDGQRNNLKLNGLSMIGRLEEIKPLLMQRIIEWDQMHGLPPRLREAGREMAAAQWADMFKKQKEKEERAWAQQQQEVQLWEEKIHLRPYAERTWEQQQQEEVRLREEKIRLRKDAERMEIEERWREFEEREREFEARQRKTNDRVRNTIAVNNSGVVKFIPKVIRHDVRSKWPLPSSSQPPFAPAHEASLPMAASLTADQQAAAVGNEARARRQRGEQDKEWERLFLAWEGWQSRAQRQQKEMRLEMQLLEEMRMSKEAERGEMEERDKEIGPRQPATLKSWWYLSSSPVDTTSSATIVSLQPATPSTYHRFGTRGKERESAVNKQREQGEGVYVSTPHSHQDHAAYPRLSPVNDFEGLVNIGASPSHALFDYTTHPSLSFVDTTSLATTVSLHPGFGTRIVSPHSRLLTDGQRYKFKIVLVFDGLDEAGGETVV
ncbi:hypothetical protein DXG01_014322 [Tephrocybe rancida]|nr:hypothetical protein DXG01_014322 [Tephrocybe rancida]